MGLFFVASGGRKRMCKAICNIPTFMSIRKA